MTQLQQQRGMVTTHTPSAVRQAQRSLQPQEAWSLLESAFHNVTGPAFASGVVEIALVVSGQLHWFESVVVETGQANLKGVIEHIKCGIPKGAHLCVLAVPGGEVQA